MGLIRMYVENMALYMAAALPFYVFARILFLKRGKKYTTVLRELAVGLFCLYIVGLASQTVIPKWDAGFDSSTDTWHFHFITTSEIARVNLVPFRTVSMFIKSNEHVSDWESVSLVNVVGNMLIFTPIGLFVPMLWRKLRAWWKVFLVGFGMTCLIEGIQFFIGRSSDIDDVILNTVGVMIGYGLFMIGSKIAR
ncbi:antibiotic resistance protein VanZ [Sporosarcina sp. NCCP-2222]|uniref:VanZ family protein n=1 Tax=Sporosarcina sp. NCCP-2222 TaxID=2935073 RepID=UPI002081B87E|nr:VanZ family protein [Sporosarcina sp. NCCP-2222]GKV57185.1 antibiotic resistance protein VanZ [Sporosarcina sp. NCCP-2222]